MQFLRIEKALNRLSGDERFYQTASRFKQILEDNELKPEDKAAQIAEIIEGALGT